jgi:hypothetical protein
LIRPGAGISENDLHNLFKKTVLGPFQGVKDSIQFEISKGPPPRMTDCRDREPRPKFNRDNRGGGGAAGLGATVTLARHPADMSVVKAFKLLVYTMTTVPPTPGVHAAPSLPLSGCARENLFPAHTGPIIRKSIAKESPTNMLLVIC